MKMKIILLGLLTFFSISLFAQSDYEIVQNFKLKIKEIETNIKNAASLDDLNSYAEDIENLRGDFSANKDLLNRSLYPDNFDRSIEKLNNSLTIRRADFTQIEVLQTEVTTLRSEIDELNRKNSELLSQIQLLEVQRNKDAATIARLEKLVADLRASILKRDELVLSMVDSLVPKLSGDVSSLTQDEKNKIIAETEKKNVLFVVKKSIRDNNRFLEVTSLKPSDLQDVKKQQDNFVSMWSKIGPKLVDVYASKKEKSQELKEIDALFASWKSGIQQEAWESIREEFVINNINLQSFYNGNEFTEVITSYINDEIKAFGVKSQQDSDQAFTLFADSVWYKSITTEWIPYLLENELLSSVQKDQIEKKISEWKSTISPADLTWLYYVIGAVVVIGGLIAFALTRRKKNIPSPPIPPSEN